MNIIHKALCIDSDTDTYAASKKKTKTNCEICGKDVTLEKNKGLIASKTICMDCYIEIIQDAIDGATEETLTAYEVK